MSTKPGAIHSASRETRTSLAATFGIQLAELSAEGDVLQQPVNQPDRSIARYKISAGISGAAFLVAILGVAEFLPEGGLWLTGPATLLAIAMAVYSGFGWYFSSGRPAQSHFRRSVAAIFIYAALFCVFASMRSDDSAQAVLMAAQIGGLSMLIYLVLDFFISRHCSSAGGA